MRPLLLAWLLVPAAVFAALTPERLRTEYLENPIGLDTPQPRLGWIDTSADRGARQSAYEILAASTEAALAADQGDLWASGKITSDATTPIPYAGTPLGTSQRVWWKVRVWDAAGQASPWSAPAFWEMGLLTRTDWHGKWIGRTAFTGESQPLPLLRRGFTLDAKVKRARAYIVGLGYFELSINGRRIGDRLLDPGYTRYDRRILYVTHDITGALRRGDNAIGVMLGNGWFNVEARAAWDFDKAPWRATPRLLCELRIELEDGRVVTIASDEQWKTAEGPITFSGIYGGETYDARREQPGWDTPGFNDREWTPAVQVDAPKGKLVAQAHRPIRVTETVKPVAVTEPAPGVFVFDAGQNLTGDAELSIAAPAGTALRMVYTEKLGKDGRADQSNIDVHIRRFGREQSFQTDTYVCKGEGTERWHARFNYNGFRYVEVTGAPGKLTPDNLAIRVFHSDVPAVGQFESSNPTLNRIWQNGRWSYLSNFFGIPTDCPHREKNGWTGDAQVASAQGLFYQDGITVYEKWANDLDDEQFITGALPGIVPTSGQWGYAFGSGPAWDSAFLIVPWRLYEYYGDPTSLKRHYDGARKYVDYLTTRAKDGIVAIGLGDWAPWKTRAPNAVTDTGYYYRDARIVATVARWLGRQADAKKYDALADSIRVAFNKTFFKPETGTYADGSQTAIACALFQGLAEPAHEAAVADALVAAINKSDDHFDCGYLGSQYIPNALAAHGRSDLACKMILQPTMPSYAYEVSQGATTLWEEWNGSGSQNHTFFGDVNAWMMRNLAGIQPDPAVPGFKHIIIAPQPVADLTSAKGSYDSVRGRIATEWTREDGVFKLRVSIPANCGATVVLPATDASKVSEGGSPVASVNGLSVTRTEAGTLTVEVGSGDYRFEVR